MGLIQFTQTMAIFSIRTSGYTKSLRQKAVITVIAIPNTIIALIYLIFLWVVCAQRVTWSRCKLRAGIQLYGCCFLRRLMLMVSHLCERPWGSDTNKTPHHHHPSKAQTLNAGYKYLSHLKLGWKGPNNMMYMFIIDRTSAMTGFILGSINLTRYLEPEPHTRTWK